MHTWLRPGIRQLSASRRPWLPSGAAIAAARRPVQPAATAMSASYIDEASSQKSTAATAATNGRARPYLEVAKKYPDQLVLVQMGSFYEIRGLAARLVAGSMPLLLSGSEMVGFPVDRLQVWLPSFYNAFGSVAIAPAVRSSPLKKAQLERDVRRVITPGTELPEITTNQGLYRRLVAIHVEQDRAGLAVYENSTGLVFTETADVKNLAEPLARLTPVELVITKSGANSCQTLSTPLLVRQPKLQPQYTWADLQLPIDDPKLFTTVVPHEWSKAGAAQKQATLKIDTFNDKSAPPVDPKELGLDTPSTTLESSALAVLLRYLRRNYTDQLPTLTSHGAQRNATLLLDAVTRNALELEVALSGQQSATVLNILDKTVTDMGHRLLRVHLSAPSADLMEINERLDAVDLFHRFPALREEVRNLLKGNRDPRRYLINNTAKSTTVYKICSALASNIITTEQLQELLCNFDGFELENDATKRSAYMATARRLADRVGKTFAQLRSEICRQFVANGQVLAFEEFPPEASLDSSKEARTFREARKKVAHIEDTFRTVAVELNKQLAAVLKTVPLRKTRSLTPLVSQEADADSDQDDDGEDAEGDSGGEGVADAAPRFVVRRTGTQLSLCLTHQAEFNNAQLLRALERKFKLQHFIIDKKMYFVTQELKMHNDALFEHMEVIESYKNSVLAGLLQLIEKSRSKISTDLDIIGSIDVASGLAEVAAEQNYVRPLLFNDKRFVAVRGRHPIVEARSHGQSVQRSFQPNDCKMESSNCWVLTGPNMGGKSTFLRQNALLVILAQMGSFVPADRLELGLVDKILSRIGAQDSLAEGKSTFMVEMTELSAILNTATDRSFVIMDEIGRGTSPYEGLALAISMISYLSNKVGCRALSATHFHELAQLCGNVMLPRAASYQLMGGYSPKQGLQLTNIVAPGSAGRSFGVELAEYCRVPREVIELARQWRLKLCQDMTHGRRILEGKE